MIYKLFITEDGRPKIGLSPTWQSLHAVDGTDKIAQAPAISEIGGGWYKFEVVYGVNPFTSPELVGVIDAGAELSDYDRYIPATISLRDLALAKLTNKATYNLITGVTTIAGDVDTATELTETITQTDNLETRTPSGS